MDFRRKILYVSWSDIYLAPGLNSEVTRIYDEISNFGGKTFQLQNVKKYVINYDITMINIFHYSDD